VPLPHHLTLAVAPGHLERLAAAAAGSGGPGARTKKYRAVYWDTARLGLWQRGIALAVEHHGTAWLQRTERAGPGGGGPQAGADAGVPLSCPEPDVARIPAPELRAAARRATARAALRPLFAVEFARRVVRLAPAHDSEIELRFDRGVIRAGARRERLCEIGLQARRGPVWRLYDAALALEARAPVKLEARSRTERGYALARDGRDSPLKADIAVVRETMNAVEAFREICFVCLAHLNGNRAGMLAGADPEYLHQMRVALRRLRSAFAVFSRALPPPALRAPLAEIRWLLGVLGAARDWDVMMAGTVAPLQAQLPGHHGLIAVRRALEARRGRAQRAARRAVASRRFQRLLLGLGAWLAGESWTSLVPLAQARKLRQPVREYAQGALARRYRQVRRRGRGRARLDAEALHRLRIAVKKLRYTGQFFAPLFAPRRAAPMLAALEALQDALGGMNDCATAARLLGEARAAARGVLVREAEALLARWNDTALAEHRRRLKAAWRKFRAAAPYWEE
jgi:triphosphatase